MRMCSARYVYSHILHCEARVDHYTLDVPAKETPFSAPRVGNGTLQFATFNLTGALLQRLDC